VQYTLWFRNDGYAIHDANWRNNFGPWATEIGSHGCINIPVPIMPSLYAWAPVGIPVRVV
jgi:lipoprotein-anchoring transpeptidase ErfK/SrfK